MVRPRNPPVTCGNRSSFKLRQGTIQYMQRGSVVHRQRFDSDLDPDPPTFCFDAYPASDPDPILDAHPFINEMAIVKYKF
jgi:hypothetical protein